MIFNYDLTSAKNSGNSNSVFIDIGEEINYLKPVMETLRHGRIKDLLFLTIFIIFIIFLISPFSGKGPMLCAEQKAESSDKMVPLFAQKKTSVFLRFGRHEGFMRVVFEGEESFINAAKVAAFPPRVKIEFPEPFNLELEAPKELPFKAVVTDKLLEVNFKEKVEIKFFRLSSPSRLVFDVQRSAKRSSQILSKAPMINEGHGGELDISSADMKEKNISSGLVKKAVMQSEEEDEDEEIMAPPVETKPPEIKGETPGKPMPPAEAKPPETKEEVPVKPATPKAEKKPSADISFFFDDADIYEVIQTIFGEVLKVNYIVDPKIKGRVNFRTTTPIPKDEVLPVMEIILRLNGIAVVEEKGLYRIISIADIPKEPAPIRFGRDPNAVELKGVAIVQVVQLKYTSSSEILKILTPLLSQGGSILDVPPSFLIIADTDANVKRLLQVVDIFDSEKLRMAKPQVFVYAVQNSKAKDIAAMLQQIFLGAKPSAAPAKQPTTVPKTATPAPTPSPPQHSAELGGEALVSEVTRIFADEVTNSIIILATPEDFATIAEAIKKIDIVPRQVMIEALLVRVDLTDNLSFGFAWSLRTGVNITNIKPFDNNINLNGEIKINPGGLDTTKLPATGFTFVGTDPKNVVRAVITALAEKSRAKILAAPHILVLDNREARIQVGQQIPLATSTTTSPLGTEVPTSTITSSVQYKDIGIILKVKPQVNESGLVSLEISQEVSSIGTPAKIAGQDFSSINKTEATTNLVAQDGETIIIGGLIREDVTKSRSGIPFLSKIPILGYLFGNTTDNVVRAELIILLTPHVMRNIQEAKDVTSDYVNRFKKTKKEIKIEEFIKEKVSKQEKGSPPESPSP